MHGEQLKRRPGKEDEEYFCPCCWNKKKNLKTKLKKKAGGKSTVGKSKAYLKNEFSELHYPKAYESEGERRLGSSDESSSSDRSNLMKK